MSIIPERMWLTTIVTRLNESSSGRVPYTIRRSDRAGRQRIIVTPKDVEVVAPLDKSLREIEAFVQSRRRWVYDEREKMREILAANPWPDHFVTGAKISYRGRRMRLRVRTVKGNSIRTGYRNGFEVDVPESIAPEDRDATATLAPASTLEIEAAIQRDYRARSNRHGCGAIGVDPSPQS